MIPSTSDIKTLPVIGSNIIFFQEVGKFENSTISSFLRGHALYTFR
jgi:hypothetical protein